VIIWDAVEADITKMEMMIIIVAAMGAWDSIGFM